MFQRAFGVLYDDPAPFFGSAVVEQNGQALPNTVADLQELMSQGQV